VSGYYLHKYLREGALPYESKSVNPHYVSGDASKDNAWSAEIETGRESEDRLTEHGGNQQEDEYALLHSTETDEGRHPGRPLSWGAKPYADYRESAGADALSPGGYEDFRREAGAGSVGPERQVSHGGGGYSFAK
jgi:hypothetical protein